MYDVFFTPNAEKDLKKLPKVIQRRIGKKITFYSKQDDPCIFSKPLINLPTSTHRFRIGSYRVAFHIVKKAIFIDRIRHRKDVYLR